MSVKPNGMLSFQQMARTSLVWAWVKHWTCLLYRQRSLNLVSVLLHFMSNIHNTNVLPNTTYSSFCTFIKHKHTRLIEENSILSFRTGSHEWRTAKDIPIEQLATRRVKRTSRINQYRTKDAIIYDAIVYDVTCNAHYWSVNSGKYFS